MEKPDATVERNGPVRLLSDRTNCIFVNTEPTTGASAKSQRPCLLMTRCDNIDRRVETWLWNHRHPSGSAR